ncbi:MAG: hypothetical protein ACO3VR_02170 [Lutimaribacter sp.]
MIRIALAATAFLGATLALVLLLPGAGPKLPEEAALTRADSLLSQPNAAPARLPLAAAPARPNLPQPRPAPTLTAGLCLLRRGGYCLVLPSTGAGLH